MLEAGEDARFIARRMVIFASEDVGMADPMALLIANAAAHAVEYAGLPEAQLNLSQACIHLATAPKSNRAALGIWNAREDVRNGVGGEVPPHLRGTGYHGAATLGHGEGYVYPHDDPRGWFQWYCSYCMGRRMYTSLDHGFEEGAASDGSREEDR
jgi:putative ATPase